MRRFIAVAVLLGFCQGCQPNPNKVELVVADGFRGTVIIKSDNLNGVVLKKVDGRYVVSIPKDGVLAIKGYDPFRSYLSTARFANGESIWVSTQIDDRPPKGRICLFGGYTQIRGDSSGHQESDFRYFVGTEEEWKASTD